MNIIKVHGGYALYAVGDWSWQHVWLDPKTGETREEWTEGTHAKPVLIAEGDGKAPDEEASAERVSASEPPPA